MSNITYKNGKPFFHPGYYLSEILEESGLTLEKFAQKLDTDSMRVSHIIDGEQGLTEDDARKLSSMLGTSISYWSNLQKAYDCAI